MLDHFSTQASGLIGLGCQLGPRVVAMLSHGDEQAELPLLWQLCLALVNFGYSVTVLDATTAESETNPGLMQLLEDAHWGDNETRDTPAWSVLPSARGIRALADRTGSGADKLQPLRSLMPPEGIVVLYCQAEPMLALVGDWRMEPLLAVSPVKTSLLTSYMALKRLLITSNLKPTIVNMLRESVPSAPVLPTPALAGLGECAKRFLGYELKTIDITEQSADLGPCAAVERLALRLLEGSVVLGAVHAPHPCILRADDGGHLAQFAGSH